MNQIEKELLELLAKKRQKEASATPEPADLPPELFGPVLQRQAAVAELPGDPLAALWNAPPPAQEDPLASLWNAPAPEARPGPDQRLAALWDSPEARTANEPDLESLWGAPGQPEIDGDMGDLAGLFMNHEAQAQADISGTIFEPGEIPMSRTASSQTDFTIEFDGGDLLDYAAPAIPRAGRFRVDRPPPTAHFNNRTVAQNDGVEVGRIQRGRFQPDTAASRFRTAAVSPRQVPGTVTVAPRPAPAPAPVQTRTPARAPSSTTAYDVIRKGGLDI